MKLTTRTRYGMRALLDIAAHSAEAPVRLKEIAARQDVSLGYLEHIVGPLISGGILRSTRGLFGGVSLMKPADEILLKDAVERLEGSLATTDCVSNPYLCPRSESCATRGLWAELTAAMESVLGSRTLADLMSNDDSLQEGSCVQAAVRPLQNPVVGASSVLSSVSRAGVA